MAALAMNLRFYCFRSTAARSSTQSGVIIESHGTATPTVEAKHSNLSPRENHYYAQMGTFEKSAVHACGDVVVDEMLGKR